MKKRTDYDAVLKRLMYESQPKPDPSKGLSVAEWADAWDMSWGHACRLLKDGAERGTMLVDYDVRLQGERMVKTRVFREVATKGKAKR